MTDWNATSFNRRQQQKQADRTNSRGGGDFLPFEMQQMLYEVNETFYARFLRPPTGNIHVKAFHWPQGGPPYACTCDHPLFGGKCVFCHYFPNKDDRAKRKTNDVIEVIDFRYFHVVPNPKRQGKNTVERCLHDEPEPHNNRCHNCNGGDPKRSVRHFGGHKVAELNNNQYNQWWAAHQKLANTCIAFHEKDGKVEMCAEKNFAVAYVCEQCEDTMVSEDDVRKTPPKQIAVFVNDLQKCQKCDKAGYPYPVFACDGGGRTMLPSEMKANAPVPEGTSHWAVQGSIFDKVVEITVAGETKDFGNGPVTMKNLNIGTGEDWSPVSDDLQHFGLSTEEIEEMCKPWDLNHRYRPMYIKREDHESDEAYVVAVLDAQAKSLNRPDPYNDSSGAERAFGGGGGGKRAFRS